MLVRARPGSPRADQAVALARRWASLSLPGLVFFHGPGLAHALPDGQSGFAALASDGLELVVCGAGWRRLDVGPVNLPFAEGSLLQFWNTALQAEAVRSFGAVTGV